MTRGRHTVEYGLHQVARRVDQHETPPGAEVLGHQVGQQGGLPRTGFAPPPQMAQTVMRCDAEATVRGMVPRSAEDGQKCISIS